MSDRRKTLHLALAFLAFVALGFPDGLLGVAWPSMRETFARSIEAVAVILVAYTSGYVTASFSSGALIARVRVGELLAASSFALGLGLAAWSIVGSFGPVPVCAFVAGLGAGAIDAGVNAYVAKEYGSRMLNWMHAAYGIGAAAGPLLLTATIHAGGSWRIGYRMVGAAGVVLGLGLSATARSWPKLVEPGGESDSVEESPALADTLRLVAARLGILAFFVYTGLEAVAGVWAYSFLTTVRGLDMAAAGKGVAVYWASLTAGRLMFGTFVDPDMVPGMLRAALVALVIGAAVVALPFSGGVAVFGFAVLGFAAGPVFPSLMGGTAARVSEPHAANAIGFQVAAAALGQSLLPGAVGIAARWIGLEVVAIVLVAASLLLFAVYEPLRRSGVAKPADVAAGEAAAITAGS
jgi:fucose permease